MGETWPPAAKSISSNIELETSPEPRHRLLLLKRAESAATFDCFCEVLGQLKSVVGMVPSVMISQCLISRRCHAWPVCG